MPDTGHGIGQWASLGNNFSINAALIVDIGEAARTMVVMGDYFKTDAIFQTNTIVDHDRVSVSGGDRAPSPTSDEDVATNIADFAQNPSIYTGFPAQFGRPELDRRCGRRRLSTAFTRSLRSTISPTTMWQRRSAAAATTTSSAATMSQGNLALIYRRQR